MKMRTYPHYFVFLLLSFTESTFGSPKGSENTVLAREFVPFSSSKASHPNLTITGGPLVALARRQDSKTCGFANGDANRPRTADAGFDCRVDTKNGLWGFCPVTVIAATDCGLAGSCIDTGKCSSGCGIANNPNITTFTCTGPRQSFCSTVLLTAGPDQTYAYLACGPSDITAHLLAEATTTGSELSKSTQSVATSTPSISSPTPASVSSTTYSTNPSSSRSSSSTFSNPSEASASTITAKSSNNETNIGPIIGGIIGGLAILCLFVLGLVFVRRYRRDHANHLESKTRMLYADALGLSFKGSQTEGKDEDPPHYQRRSAQGTTELPTWRSPVELSG